MDASLFQFFIEEFGDTNCTLMDAFQDTLYENSSFASMSVDGGITFSVSAFVLFSSYNAH